MTSTPNFSAHLYRKVKERSSSPDSCAAYSAVDRARGLGHLLQREVHVLPQSANTPRHLFDIRLHDLRPPYRFSKMTVARYFTGISAVSISNRLKSRRCAYSFSRSLAIARCEDEMEKSFCRRQFLLDAKRAAQDLEIVLFWPAEGLQEKRRYRKAHFQERVTK